MNTWIYLLLCSLTDEMKVQVVVTRIFAVSVKVGSGRTTESSSFCVRSNCSVCILYSIFSVLATTPLVQNLHVY